MIPKSHKFEKFVLGKNLKYGKKIVTLLLFTLTPLFSLQAADLITGNSDECDGTGSIWSRSFNMTDWGFYGTLPSNPLEVDKTEAAGLFCSDHEAHNLAENENFWPRRMWHNGRVKLKLECDNDPDGVSGCGILCVQADGNIIPEQIIISQNGQYQICTADKAGNAVVQDVYVNWIDWGGPESAPVGRPNIIKQGGKKLVCKLDNGSIYNGEWLNANDGDVTCGLMVEDHSGNGSVLPKIESGAVQIDNEYLTNWYQVQEAGFSGVKRIEFFGPIFDFLSETERIKDMLTPLLVTNSFDFTFTDDIEKVAEPSNTTGLRVTDYAGNNNTTIDQSLADWVLRIDRTVPIYDEGLKCFSKPKNKPIQEYTGEESINHAYFPNGWTNTNIECSYCLLDPKKNNSNSKLESWNSTTRAEKSGMRESWTVNESGRAEDGQVCEPFLYTQEQDQEYDLEGRMSDIAGNTLDFEENYFIKIDTKALEFDEGIRMKRSDESVFRVLSGNQSSSTKFEAHEQFSLRLGIAEPAENEAPIDWVHSWISIQHTPGEGATEVASSISNIAFSNLPSGIEFNSNYQEVTFTDDSDILENAGDYEFTFYLVDQAQNEQAPTTVKRYVQIVSSEIDPQSETSKSEFLDITTDTEVYANNTDERELNIKLRDRFGNLIFNREIEVIILDQDTSKSVYDLTQAGGISGFTEGLSFNSNVQSGTITTGVSNQVWNYDTGDIADHDFSVRSYLPSVKVIHGYGGASMLIEQTDGAGQIIGQVATFEFTGPSINADGTENNTDKDIVRFEKTLHFRPIVYGYMANKIDGDSNNINFIDVLSRMIGQEIELVMGEEFPFFAYANTGGDGGVLLPERVPSNFGTIIQAHALSGIRFEAKNYGDGTESERTLGFCPGNSYCSSSEGSELTQTHPLPSGGSIQAPNFAFSSEITTKVGTKDVIYPGGNLGNDLGDGHFLFDDSLFDGDKPAWFNDAKITIIRIEADIEGDILGDKDNYSYTIDSPGGGVGKSNILEMGGVSAKDIREEITRRAYEIVRGTDSQQLDLENGWTFEAGGNNVLYFKGNGQNSATNLVKMGGSFTGKGTVVIEDANVLITSDMQYWTTDDLEDSLGIILINSQIKDEAPDTGNIYITPDIKQMVGSYFAEGSLLSATYGGNGTIPNPDSVYITGIANRVANLPAQLVITGTILTQNTLGGVVDEISGLGQNRTPWGPVPNDEDGLNEAVKYDLHWLRRYTPNVPTYTDQSGTDRLTCSTSAAGSCDKNKHATVIRSDGKVKNITPPGFNIGTLINR